jgi:hypothetical protein
MGKPRKKDSIRNYFDEDRAKNNIELYYQTNNMRYVEELYNDFVNVIKGMINKEFSSNNIIKDKELQQDAISSCLLEIYKSISLKRFKTEKGRVFGYVNRIIKNTLLQFYIKNIKNKEIPITSINVNSDDTEMSNNEAMDLLKETNKEKNNIENIGTNIRIFDFMKDDSKTKDKTLKRCKKDFTYLYNFFNQISININKVLTTETEYNKFYNYINSVLDFDEYKINAFGLFDSNLTHPKLLKKSLKEINRIMNKLMNWIESEYSHKIPIIPNIYKENPSIFISVDFKKYISVLSQEIENSGLFYHKSIKNNLISILKILSGMDLLERR